VGGVTAAYRYVIALWLLLAGKGSGVTVAWACDCIMVTVDWEGFGGPLLPWYVIALW
jgi:hypothetical protein